MKKILLLLIMFVSGQIFSQATYTSAGDGNWNSSAFWTVTSGTDDDSDGVPDSNDNVVIEHNITVVGSRSCSTLQLNYVDGKKLTISGNGASLTVAGTTTNSGEILVTGGSAANPATLTLNGNLSNFGPIQINSGQRLVMASGIDVTATNPITIKSNSNSHGSFYFTGTWTKAGASGVINYNRHISNLSTWDLISVPVSDLSISSFAQGETDLATNGAQYAIGTYTNTTAAASAGNTWQNYTTGTAPSAGNFIPAKGYQMAAKGTNSGSGVGAEMTFSGKPNTGTIPISITNAETGNGSDNDPADGSRFNLVGNPYPSFISVSAFLTANSSILGNGHEAVYGWNGSSYTTYNSASGAYIAPGQGFMVGADSGSATLSFTTGMQSTGNTSMDDFISGDQLEDRAELFLGYSSSEYSNKTEIYFLENTTDLLDIAYDAVTIDFDHNNGIHTRLLDGPSDNRNFVIQSLSYSEMNDKVIPLVINGFANEEFSVSILHRTTPADINIYLEDTFLNTITNLKDEDFVLNPISDLSGAGRFYIHLTEDTMSTIDVSSNLLNAYKDANSDFITVEGLSSQEGIVNISLFNILGSKVLKTSFDNSLNQRVISTQAISQGIYVIELESSGRRVTKKILIK
jgi:hypothetical protein